MKNILLMLLGMISFISVGQSYGDGDFELSNIRYDYELIDDNGVVDCIGTFSFTVEIPKAAVRLVCERSRAFSTLEDFLKYPRSKRVLNINDENMLSISHDRVRRGTFFRLYIETEDSMRLYSHIYSVDSLISDDDWQSISGTTSAEEIEKDNVDIYVKSGELIIDSPVYWSVEIYNLMGSCILTQNQSGKVSIPINTLSQPYLIIKYQSAKKLIIKKIKVI